MPHVARGELRGHAVARARELPEEFRHRQELLELDVGVNVDAVDAERGQLADECLVRLIVRARCHAVEVHITANDVDAQRLAVFRMASNQVA